MELQLAPVRQHVVSERMTDIQQITLEKLSELPLSEHVLPNMHIAVGVGSRGISCIEPVVKTVVEELQRLGAKPFLVPAMGSHGGGTPEGQRAVLESYGLGPDALGIPIRSSMDTVQIGATPDGMPVFMDVNAAGADGIIVINRVKEHTAFKGRWESGLLKMLAVGLGKACGAAEIHKWGLRDAMPAAARVVLATKPVLAGIAIVEDGNHEAARIAVLPPGRIADEEANLLELARRYLPRIPFEPVDLLIVQEIGKDISGTGMDLNVIGMWRRTGGPIEPDIRTIVALDLTDNSHGNAIGIGYADLIPQRLRDKMDPAATYKNCLTARNFSAGKVPITLASDQDVIEEGLRGLVSSQARVVLIRNTLELEHFWISKALLEAAAVAPNIEVVGPLRTLPFDDTGHLLVSQLDIPQ